MTNEDPEPAHGKQHHQPEPDPVRDHTLALRTISVERKTFTFRLKENMCGRCLSIREDARGMKAGIIIPASGLEGFRDVICRMLAACREPADGEKA